MSVPGPADLPGALIACAAGIHTLEAAAELNIGCGCWLRRGDFTGRFITAAPDGGDAGAMLASIDWEAAIAALDTGELPCSNGERRVLRLAASIAAGTPVSLSDALTGIDDRNATLAIYGGRPSKGKNGNGPVSGPSAVQLLMRAGGWRVSHRGQVTVVTSRGTFQA
jgi:hypothetical protein